MSDSEEVYIGDGLYASYDGYMFTLRTQRSNGDNYVCLEPGVVEDFFRYVEKCCGVKITVAKAEKSDE